MRREGLLAKGVSSDTLRGMGPKCGALICGILCAVVSMTTRAGVTYVLEADAATQLKEMLQLDEPLAGDLRLSASIAGSTVGLSGSREGTQVFSIRLVHPLSPDAVETVGGGLSRDGKPLPSEVLDVLKKRIADSGQMMHWKAIDERKTPLNPQGGVAEQSPLELGDVFAAIEHKITIGDTENARRLLESLPPSIDAWAVVEVAFFWKRLGDAERLQSALSSIEDSATAQHAALALAKDILEDKQVDFSKAIAGKEASACDTVLAVNLLQRLERLKEARKIATAIRSLDPTCVGGWETEISLHLLLDDKNKALSVAKEAQRALPQAPGLWQVLAYLYQETGELEKAVELLDKAVRVGKPTGGSLRNLLGTVVRNSDNRQKYLKSYLERHRADANDTVSQMIAGVILHYENRFEESDKLLSPLEGTLGHSDRLHIYLAMNAFNRGEREVALERLNQRADGPSPDPDVFYCRAEILRDTNRQQARDDLERYRMMSEGRRFSNPDKDERIRQLTELLDACIADGRSSCEGPWEHPRLRHQDNNTMWWQHPVFYALCAGVLGLGWWFGLRRRKTSEAA